MAKPHGRKNNFTETTSDFNEFKLIQRHGLEELFNTKVINIQNEKFNILHYYGIGGIGKSTLKNTLMQKMVTNPNTTTISIDVSHDKKCIPIHQLFEEIEHQLSILKPKKFKLLEKIKAHFLKPKYFNKACEVYFRKQNPNIAYKKSQYLLGGSKMAAAVYDHPKITFVITAAEVIWDYIISYYNKILNYIIKKNTLNKLDVLKYINKLNDLTLEEIELNMPYFIGKDIEKLLEKKVYNNHNFLFFIDTYEVVEPGSHFEEIIQSLINETHGLNCMFVLLGREKLNWDTDWENFLLQKNIEGFNKKDSESYLMNNGLNESHLIEIIFKNSDGVPLYLQAALKIYKEIKSKDITPDISHFEDTVGSKIIDKMLKYSDDSTILLYRVLSLIDQFDLDLFEYIRKEFSIIKLFEKIKYDSFIGRKEKQYYSLHNVMKEVIIPTISSEEKESIHKKIFKYYKFILEASITEYNIITIENVVHHGLKLKDQNTVFDWFIQVEAKINNAITSKNSLIPIYIKFADELISNKKSLSVNFKLFDLYYDLKKLDEAQLLLDNIRTDNTLSSQNLLLLKYNEALLKNKRNHKLSKSQAKSNFQEVLEKINDRGIRIDCNWKLLKLATNKELKEFYFIKLQDEIKYVNDPLLKAKIYLYFGEYYTFTKKYALAEEAFSSSFQIYSKHLSNKHPDIADLYLAYSFLYEKIETSVPTKSISYTLKALRIYEDVYTSHQDINICYKRLSNWFINEVKYFLNDVDHYKLYYAVVQTYLEKNYDFPIIQTTINTMLNSADDKSIDFAHAHYIHFGIFIGKRNYKASEVEKFFTFAFDLNEISDNQLVITFTRLYYFYKDLHEFATAETYLIKKLNLINTKNDHKGLFNVYREMTLFYTNIKNFHKNYEILKKRSEYYDTYSINDKIMFHNDFSIYYNNINKSLNEKKRKKIFPWLEKINIFSIENIFKKHELDSFYIDINFYNIHKNPYYLRCIDFSIQGQVYHLLEKSKLYQSEYSYNPDKLDEIYTMMARIDKKKAELYYYKIIKLWDNNEYTLSKLDRSYRKLLDYYESTNFRDINKIQQCYLKQIEIREQTDNLEKLEKAYSYYASFLDRKLNDITSAENYYLKALNLYQKNNIDNQYEEEIIFISLKIAAFYLERKLPNYKDMYLKVIELVKYTNEFDIYCNVIETVAHTTKNIISEEILVEAKERLFNNQQFILFIDKIYPLFTYHYYCINDTEKNNKLESEIKNLYKKNNLAGSHKESFIAEMALIKDKLKDVNKFEKEDILRNLKKNIKNKLHLLKVIDNVDSTLTFCHFSSELCKIYLLDELKYIMNVWELILKSANFDDETRCNENLKIANIYSNYDNAKYLQYIYLYMIQALDLGYSNEAISKKLSIALLKANESNNNYWINKFDLISKKMNIDSPNI